MRYVGRPGGDVLRIFLGDIIGSHNVLLLLFRSGMRQALGYPATAYTRNKNLRDNV